MTEIRTVLKEVPSGKIEVVFNGVFSVLEFNAECLDCLPTCHAMCCRLRAGYTVTLLEEEEDKYVSRPSPLNAGLKILQDKKEDSSCVYLNSESSVCTIHDHHPWACRVWHCSPGGKGEAVKYRDGGWLLTPTGYVQHLGDGEVLDVRKVVSCKV